MGIKVKSKPLIATNSMKLLSQRFFDALRKQVVEETECKTFQFQMTITSTRKDFILHLIANDTSTDKIWRAEWTHPDMIEKSPTVFMDKFVKEIAKAYR